MMLRKMLVSLAVVLAVAAGGTMGILADDVGVTDTTQGVISSETVTDSETGSSEATESGTSAGVTTQSGATSESTANSESTTQSESTSASATTKGETTSKGDTTSKTVTTPNSETTSSEVISGGEIETGNKLKINADLQITENEYVEVSENEYRITFKTKKAGYYDIICKDEETGKFSSVSTEDFTFANTAEKAVKWQYFDVGELTDFPVTRSLVYWVYYSENGTDISAVLEIDINDYIDYLYGNADSADYDISFTYSLEPKGKGVELTMNCETEGGLTLSRVRYYEWNKKKEVYVYKGYLHTFAPEITSETVKHTFNKNGKYKLVLEGAGGYYSEAEINITECESGVIFSDEEDPTDTKAPKITANIDSAKNLKVGTDTCKIVIKSDEPVYLFINNAYKAELVTEYVFYAGGNGEYLIRGNDESANESEIKVVVNAFAKVEVNNDKFKVTPLSELERTWGEDGVGKVYLPDELSIDYSDSSNAGTGTDSQSPQTGVFNYLWLLIIAAVCGLIATFFVIRYNKKRSEKDSEISSVIE